MHKTTFSRALVISVTASIFILSTCLLSLPSHSEDFDKAIYGSDDRVEAVAPHGDPNSNLYKWMTLANSTAAMVARDRLMYNERKDQFTIKTDKTLITYGICPDERFATQPMVANCTGFLIAPDTILTAGHCVAKKDALESSNGSGRSASYDQRACDEFRWVFDYRVNEKGEVNTTYSRKQVFQCRKIEKFNFDPTNSADFAVIKLYREVNDRKPLELDIQTPAIGTNLMIIGHPTGLPSKMAGGAKIDHLKKFAFQANLDSFAGNSGSPVFNADTKKVIGILVSGQPDYVYDEVAKCARVSRCMEENCPNEVASFVGNAFNPQFEKKRR